MIKKVEQCFEFSNHVLAHKINELVDAINPILEERESQIKVYEETMEIVERNDPYAEQRKWVGKLCWFWDFKRANAIIGVLTDFETDNPQFRKDGLSWYQCCEPVKPDDDIIYQKD